MNARTRSPAVDITGMGAVSPLGDGCEALWAALDRGADGIREIERFSTDAFDVHVAATVPGWPAPDRPGRAAVEYAVVAAREAWGSASLGAAGIPPSRVAVVLGTSLGTHREGFHEITEAVAEAIGAAGPRLTVSVACTSSTNALGLGRDLLASGAADVVLAGGTDVLTEELFAGFHALGVLSRGPCAPFSDPPGTSLGEGAGFLVLEPLDRRRRPGAPRLATLLGYGLSADAFHATAPDPSGAGVARAIRAALDDAGLSPDDVGYVNAHGTGTESNDAAEWRGIRAVLGAGADRIPVSSSKSFLGHAQGAAGVLETICALLALRNGKIPPTLHFRAPRPRCPPDPVGEQRPRPHAWRFGVSTNSAFGGANAAVAIGACAAPSPRHAERREVFIAGAGSVGPHGIDPAALEASLVAPPRRSGRAAPVRLESVVRGADPRGLDPSALFVTVAAALAAGEAGGAPRGAARDRAGIVLGATRLSAAAVREHRASIEERGLARLSSSAFTRMVLNAPAGSAARALGLRGPTSTLAAGEGAGLAAIAYAAEILAWQTAADTLLAVGVDELDADEEPEGRAEGAGCLALSTAPGGGRPRLAGWAFSAPGDAAGAARRALSLAALPGEEIAALYGDARPEDLAPLLGRALDLVDVTQAIGRAPSAGSAFAAVLATRAVRRGDAGAALVVTPGGSSAACAVVLVGGGEP